MTAALAADPADVIANYLRGHVVDTIKHAAANAPRSLQRAMGMSEVGSPCAARLARQMLDMPRTNEDTDPWASIIGTAVHTWLEQTFGRIRETLPDGRPRYVIERRVHADGTLSGSADLFDRLLRTVIDWKVPGATAMKEYRAHGPSAEYRTQAHGYGKGYRNAGETVDFVAIVFLPRGGFLKDTHVWVEPLDESVIDTAIARRAAIAVLANQLNVDEHPDNWQHIPTADAHCAWCPWFLPGSKDLAAGCPGHAGRPVRSEKFEGLIG